MAQIYRLSRSALPGPSRAQGLPREEQVWVQTFWNRGRRGAWAVSTRAAEPVTLGYRRADESAEPFQRVRLSPGAVARLDLGAVAAPLELTTFAKGPTVRLPNGGAPPSEGLCLVESLNGMWRAPLALEFAGAEGEDFRDRTACVRSIDGAAQHLELDAVALPGLARFEVEWAGEARGSGAQFRLHLPPTDAPLAVLALRGRGPSGDGFSICWGLPTRPVG